MLPIYKTRILVLATYGRLDFQKTRHRSHISDMTDDFFSFLRSFSEIGSGKQPEKWKGEVRLNAKMVFSFFMFSFSVHEHYAFYISFLHLLL